MTPKITVQSVQMAQASADRLRAAIDLDRVSIRLQVGEENVVAVSMRPLAKPDPAA